MNKTFNSKVEMHKYIHNEIRNIKELNRNRLQKSTGFSRVVTKKLGFLGVIPQVTAITL